MSRKAFTLVELLVVIGIIALLTALLLPALNDARERSRQAQCASNLRTLAIGLMVYSQDNHGALPGIATSPQQPWDWIYWAPWQGSPYNVFANGPLCRYIGKDESVFRCPSDDALHHTVPIGATEQPQGPYLYSYMINAFSVGGIARYQCCLVTDQAHLSNVHHPSDKILLLEGNEQTIIDGVWVPPPNTGSYDNDLGDRHDRHAGRNNGLGRGNAAFADTHVEFVTPAFAHDPQHYIP